MTLAPSLEADRIFTTPYRPEPTLAQDKPEVDPGDLALASKFDAMADILEPQIAAKFAGRLENTQKRARQGMQARHDGHNLELGQKALRALAQALRDGDLPKILAGIRRKSQVLDMVRCRLETVDYHHVRTGDPIDQSEAAKALRALMAAKSGETPEESEERKRKAKIAELEAKIRFSNIPGFFPTPKPVIDRMLDLAEVDNRPGCWVLEPSAGKGDIADAIRARSPQATLWAVEVNHTLCEILEVKGHRRLDGGNDFLAMESPYRDGIGSWHRIIMNPPFEKAQEIDHVRHAYRWLDIGGRLVSVMSPGPFSRNDRKSVEFREWLDRVGAEVEDLPAGSFSGADAFRQTGVSTKLVVINRKFA